jgi:hypothetical protein
VPKRVRAVDESMPPGFGITYTKPPPASPDLPMPYLVTPEHDPAKGGDPAYEWLHYALWRVNSRTLEEFAADVRSVLSGQTESVGVDGLVLAPGVVLTLKKNASLISYMGEELDKSVPFGKHPTKDANGHIIGKRFGGIDDPRNSMAQLKAENGSGGLWYQAEDDISLEAAKLIGEGELKANPNLQGNTDLVITIVVKYDEAAITAEVKRYNAALAAGGKPTLNKDVFRPTEYTASAVSVRPAVGGKPAVNGPATIFRSKKGGAIDASTVTVQNALPK